MALLAVSGDDAMKVAVDLEMVLDALGIVIVVALAFVLASKNLVAK